MSELLRQVIKVKANTCADMQVDALEKSVDSTSSLLNEEPSWGAILECPICYDKMAPPIFQCQEGHLVCNVCRPKIEKCPTCRAKLGNIRNRALERCISKVKLPCQYAANGCKHKVLVGDMTKHMKKCNYRAFDCPRSRSKCQWSGDVNKVSEHLVERHKMKMVDSNTIDETYSNPEGVKGAVWEGPIMKCFGKYFVLHFEQRKSEQFVAFIRYVGPKEDANNYKYSLRIERHGRCMRWEGVPRSIRTTAKAVQEVNDCLIIEKNMALFFSDSKDDGSGDLKNLRLSIRGHIYEKSAVARSSIVVDTTATVIVDETCENLVEPKISTKSIAPPVPPVQVASVALGDRSNQRRHSSVSSLGGLSSLSAARQAAARVSQTQSRSSRSRNSNLASFLSSLQ